MNDRNSLYGDELLVSVLAQLPPRSTFRLGDQNEIVAALYNASRIPKYQGLFTNYSFDLDGIEPTSRELTEALDSLQQSRLLGRMNPDLIDYTISPAMQIRYKTFVEHKVQGQESVLRDLAEFLRDELRVCVTQT